MVPVRRSSAARLSFRADDQVTRGSGQRDRADHFPGVEVAVLPGGGFEPVKPMVIDIDPEQLLVNGIPHRAFSQAGAGVEDVLGRVGWGMETHSNNCKLTGKGILGRISPVAGGQGLWG